MNLVIISGLSGSGKTIALHTLEDIGYYCTDNLPVGLLDAFALEFSQPHLARVKQVAVGIDARGGRVSVEGWAEASELGAVELARRFEGAGVAAIIYTDIDRDGVLAGINWESTLALAASVDIPVIASGGLASMEDIERLTQPDAAVLEGAISGRALYDGRIDPSAALAMLDSVAGLGS